MRNILTAAIFTVTLVFGGGAMASPVLLYSTNIGGGGGGSSDFFPAVTGFAFSLDFNDLYFENSCGDAGVLGCDRIWTPGETGTQVYDSGADFDAFVLAFLDPSQNRVSKWLLFDRGAGLQQNLASGDLGALQALGTTVTSVELTIESLIYSYETGPTETNESYSVSGVWNVYGTLPGAAVVPLPAGLILLGSGLGGFALVRRRRKTR